MKRAIVTVVGKDKAGIVAGVSATLADQQVNILDLSQTIMGEMFTMSMLVDITAIDESFNDLQNALSELAKSLGVEIHTQREEIFDAISKI
jgi:ACT domain-containing protein